MATVAPALFQTCCSACEAIQTVTPEALKTQSGLLSCSECGATFNAAWSLVDQIPNPARLTQFVPASSEPVLPGFEPDSYGDSAASALRDVHEPHGHQQPSNGLTGRREPVLFVDDNDAQGPLGLAPSQVRQSQRAVRSAWAYRLPVSCWQSLSFLLKSGSLCWKRWPASMLCGRRWHSCAATLRANCRLRPTDPKSAWCTASCLFIGTAPTRWSCEFTL